MKFTVKLKRTVYAELVIEADSVKQARDKLNGTNFNSGYSDKADALQDHFLTASYGTDVVSIVSVEPKPI